MKKFTQLALAASVALSANAMAMQAMDDASLSTTTGQDGLSIGIGISKIEIEKLYVHDNDGLDNAALGGTGDAGAIYIKANGTGATAAHGVVVGANYANGGAYLLPSRNLADLVIDSDGNGGDAFINIAAAVSGLDINIGEIGVTSSVGSTAPAGTRRGGTGNENAILTGLSLKTGQLTANIQLGAAPQGAMITLDSNIVGGITIEDLGIVDNSTAAQNGGTAGVIHLDSIKLTDANSNDLAVKAAVSVFGAGATSPWSANSDGYIRIVSTSGAHDTYVAGVRLGSQAAASIGDIEINGMQTYYSPAQGSYIPGSIITIAGH